MFFSSDQWNRTHFFQFAYNDTLHSNMMILRKRRIRLNKTNRIWVLLKTQSHINQQLFLQNSLKFWLIFFTILSWNSWTTFSSLYPYDVIWTQLILSFLKLFNVGRRNSLKKLNTFLSSFNSLLMEMSVEVSVETRNWVSSQTSFSTGHSISVCSTFWWLDASIITNLSGKSASNWRRDKQKSIRSS